VTNTHVSFLKIAFPVAFAAAGCAPKATPIRSVRYLESIRVPAAERAVRLWVPLPQADAHQIVKRVSIQANAIHRRTREREFGNELLYVEGKPGEPIEIDLEFIVHRRERRGGRGDGPARLPDALKARFTEPRGLVKVDRRIRALAEEHGGEGGPVKVSRRFYEHILDFMAYDKKEPGWGKGDSLRACVVGLGNCTDFHSLFQAMASAKGIPTRFRMGLPLGKGPRQTFEGKGYHCWVDFHADGIGWYPADISEAWKVRNGKKEMDPAWVERYFGSLDSGRILLSSGRELRLEPPQEGPPLNYFAYPYAEAGGRPIEGIAFTRTIVDFDPETGG
jgi:transglutaminase-like putative cysteine protease